MPSGSNLKWQYYYAAVVVHIEKRVIQTGRFKYIQCVKHAVVWRLSERQENVQNLQFSRAVTYVQQVMISLQANTGLFI